MKASLVVLLIHVMTLSEVQAAILEVPELCYSKKISPCLTQIQGKDEALVVRNATFKITSSSILQWNDFMDLSVDLLKGSLIVSGNLEPFKLNEIFISKPHQMIQRRENLIQGLDLNSFILSTYKLSEVRSNTVLLKSEFLEKSQLLKYVAGFFERKSLYVSFLKSIESLWKVEFAKQTAIQTKVLERSLASVEKTQQVEVVQKQRQNDELKKVREQFFYRTFYR